jgi:hypothetical protein
MKHWRVSAGPWMPWATKRGSRRVTRWCMDSSGFHRGLANVGGKRSPAKQEEDYEVSKAALRCDAGNAGACRPGGIAGGLDALRGGTVE